MMKTNSNCYTCKHWKPKEGSGFPFCKKYDFEVTSYALTKCKKNKWYTKQGG